jgi:hypothetical protein
MTLTARTLGSWVRIPLDAWTYVSVFLYFVVLCRQGTCDGPIPLQGALPKYLKVFTVSVVHYKPKRSQRQKTVLHTRRCIQKFPDWLPGARTATDTALCH